MRAGLEKKGHRMTTAGAWTMGSNGAILVDYKMGVVNAGADPRVDAYALAW